MDGRRKLKTLCETRWMARADALMTFMNSFHVVVHALETLDEDGDTKAVQHLASVLRFDFIVLLVVAQHVLGNLVGLITILQKPDMDLLEAVRETRVALRVFQDERDDMATWNALYQQAVDLAAEHKIPPSVPRIVGRQQHRANHHVQDPSDYWRVTMYYVFLDHLTQEMTDRILNHEDRYIAHRLIPTEVSGMTLEEEGQLTRTFQSDVQCSQQVFHQEMNRWKVSWAMEQGTKPKTLLETLNCSGIDAYPHIKTILRVVLTMPATSASCERSFIAMRRIKSYLRSTMSGDRLSSLAVLHIHRTLPVNIEHVLDRFATAKNRIMQFL